MLKVLHVLSVFTVLWISAVISQDCLYQMQVWGGEDPNVFYYCNLTTNQSEVVSCESGKGFVNNETSTGCVPWEEWNDNCVEKTNVSSITCEGQTFIQPHAVANPGVFYLCPAQNSTPVELECPEGSGFYAQKYYLGCFPWEMWRNITGCLN